MLAGCSGADLASTNLDRAKEYYNKGQYADSVPFLDAVLAVDPKNPEGLGMRVAANAKMEKWDLVVKDCTTTIGVAPESVQAPMYAMRGLAYFELGKNPEAIADLSKSITLDKSDPEVFNTLSLCYMETGDLAKAVACCDEAIKANPKNAKAYSARGMANMQEKKSALAVADFTEAINYAPNNADFYSFRGQAYMDEDAYEKALADFNKSVSIKPSAAALTYRSSILYGKHQTAKAFEDINKAIALDPHFGTAYYERGEMYKREGKKDLSKKDLDKAKALEAKED